MILQAFRTSKVDDVTKVGVNTPIHESLAVLITVGFYGILKASLEPVEVTTPGFNPFLFVGIEFNQVDFILHDIHAVMTRRKRVIDTLEVVQIPFGSFGSASLSDVSKTSVQSRS